MSRNSTSRWALTTQITVPMTATATVVVGTRLKQSLKCKTANLLSHNSFINIANPTAGKVRQSRLSRSSNFVNAFNKQIYWPAAKIPINEIEAMIK